MTAPRLLPTPQPDPQPEDLASCLAGPNGLDLVVELAHDLRSPLTSILFLAEALQEGQNGPVNDAQRRSLGLIYSAAMSLCASASDVLELARGGKGLVENDPAPFSLSEMFQSVRDLIMPLAVEKQLDVRIVLPKLDRRVGHPRALSRVLLNLATNAVKFTDSGFVEVAARAVSPTRLEFSVSDSGDGIDAATLRTLFQPFRKAASETADARHHFSSAGLGLAICRKLVRALGAELHIETGPQRGSRFFFSLEVPLPPPMRIARVATPRVRSRIVGTRVASLHRGQTHAAGVGNPRFVGP